VIIPTTHLDHFINPRKLVADRSGIGQRPRGIEAFDQIAHRRSDAFRRRSTLHRELLVRDGPHEYAGMIAIATNQSLNSLKVRSIAAEEPVLVHDQHAKMVT